MKRPRFFRWAAVLAAALPAFLAGTARAHEVTEWHRHMLTTLVTAGSNPLVWNRDAAAAQAAYAIPVAKYPAQLIDAGTLPSADPACAGRAGRHDARVSMKAITNLLPCVLGACIEEPSTTTRTDHLGHGWYKVGATEPGLSSHITIDPAGSGTIYLATVGGGIRKSTNRGVTWTSVGPSPAVYSFAMDASGPNTIYAGVFSSTTGRPSGVYKSTDGGATWAISAGTSGVVAMSLAADPMTPGIVYMGALGGFLRKTTDGGATWQQTFSGTSPIPEISVDPSNRNNVYFASLAGAYSSSNAGQTWSRMSLTAPNIWSVAVDALQPNVLYAGTNDHGIWKSGDYGASWAVASAAPFATYDLAVEPASGVYAATSSGVWKSTDGGSTWKRTSFTDRVTHSVVAAAGGVLVGTAIGAGVSFDAGASWTELDPGLGGSHGSGYAVTIDPNDGSKIFVSVLASTIVVSIDAGASWAPAEAGYATREPRRIAIDPTDSRRVYAASFYAGGVFTSVDGGASWTRHRIGSPQVYTWIPAVDPVSPNIAYVGTQGEGLFKSQDHGNTWTQMTGPANTVQGLTVDPANNNRVFAATTTGIWLSTNAGGSWSNVLSNPSWAVTLVPGTQVAYAATKTAGVYKSFDGGSTWTPSNNGITNLTLGRSAPVIVDPVNPKILYVGSEGGGGVYKSKTAGASWTAVNRGLTDTSVFGLAIAPDDRKTLYASGPSGVFKTRFGGD